MIAQIFSYGMYRDESQYQAAMARVEELLPLVPEETPLTDKNSVELVLLSNLVANYDDEHYPVKSPSLLEVLKLKMYEMNLTQKKIGKHIRNVACTHERNYIRKAGVDVKSISRHQHQTID